jgi:hypothetical protein
VVGLGQDRDLLDGSGVVAEGVANAVAKLFDVVVGVDRHRQVTHHGGHDRDGAVGLEVDHLVADAGVGGPQQANVGDVLAEHEQPVQAQAQGQAVPPG